MACSPTVGDCLDGHAAHRGARGAMHHEPGYQELFRRHFTSPSRPRFLALVAPLVRHRRLSTPSTSCRYNDRFTDPIHGLESLESGPQLWPVEPASVLPPKGAGRAVSWHGS